MNLLHLHILSVMLANLQFPLSSAYPVLYNGVSNQDNGFLVVTPDFDLGLEAGYGYVYDDTPLVSYSLRCYDYFAFLYDTYSGNSGITATAGSGFSYLSNASYLTLTRDDYLNDEGVLISGGLFHFSNNFSLHLSSAHIIVPDILKVRSFNVSLASNSSHSSDYWEHRLIPVVDMNLWQGNVTALSYLNWNDFVVSSASTYDYTDIYVPNGYAIVFYHVYDGEVNSGSPIYSGYEVNSILEYNSDIPSDWGADNLLTLFGYLFIGMSSIFSIVVFPGLTLGTILLFPLALGVLSLIWKLVGN